jgi:hypothetical protein
MLFTTISASVLWCILGHILDTILRVHVLIFNYQSITLNPQWISRNVLDIIEINIQQYVLFTHSDLHILFRIISFQLFYAITCISYQKIIEHIYICRFREHKPKPVKTGIQTNLWNQGYKQTCETRDTNKYTYPSNTVQLYNIYLWNPVHICNQNQNLLYFDT